MTEKSDNYLNLLNKEQREAVESTNGSDDSDKDLIADYYQCIVECDGNMSVCKNICKEVFLD